jgi:tetratricopeptide (TPR) repeat protein
MPNFSGFRVSSILNRVASFLSPTDLKSLYHTALAENEAAVFEYAEILRKLHQSSIPLFTPFEDLNAMDYKKQLEIGARLPNMMRFLLHPSHGLPVQVFNNTDEIINRFRDVQEGYMRRLVNLDNGSCVNPMFLDGRSENYQYRFSQHLAQWGDIQGLKLFTSQIDEPVHRAYVQFLLVQVLLAKKSSTEAKQVIEEISQPIRKSMAQLLFCKERIASREIEEARAIMNEISYSQHKAEAQLHLCGESVLSGKMDDAIVNMNQIAEPRFKNQAIYYVMVGWIKRGKIEQAEQLMGEIESRSHEKAKAELLLAKVWIAKGKFEKVMTRLNALDESDPTKSKIKCELIRAWAKKGEIVQAKGIIQDNSFYRDEQLMVLVSALIADNKIDEAMIELNAFSPSNSHDLSLARECKNKTQLICAEYLLAKDRIDEAKSLIREIPHSREHDNALLALVEKLESTGQEESKREAKKIREMNERVMFAFFKSLLAQKKIEEAKNMLQEEFTSYSKIHANVELLVVQGEIERAQEERFTYGLMSEDEQTLHSLKKLFKDGNMTRARAAIDQINPKLPKTLSLKLQAEFLFYQLALKNPFHIKFPPSAVPASLSSQSIFSQAAVSSETVPCSEGRNLDATRSA